MAFRGLSNCSHCTCVIPAAQSNENGQPSRLIIDDERPVLMTLEALLKRHGYHVDTAATASQGLKLLKSNSPSLVLLDLQLPDATVGNARPDQDGVARSTVSF